MDLEGIRQERKKWLKWKNIAPLQEALASMPDEDISSIFLDDTISINFKHITTDASTKIDNVAKLLMPWRKGPFAVAQTQIDSEWQSWVKYNLLEPHFDVSDKIVGDIGCNNGYYLFRMLKQNPKRLVGFDPSAVALSQFEFINHFIKSDIVYELLGVEHVEFYEHKFDILFCLGVLYHRSDPISTLKSLYRGLNSAGELILDTFMIDGEDEVCLVPKERYSKMKNVYFIPTVSALENWCLRAGFDEVEVLCIKTTSVDEQRKTDWIATQSLEDFLDPTDSSKTIEGYPAPKRVYIKAKKYT